MSQPQPDTPVCPGEILAGKYRVEHVLGTGGMGVVVAATHMHLQELVALKFVHHDSITQEAVMRFQREGQAAVRLKSEHVARVLDIGTLENGAPFMVMEYLEGSDLSKVVRSRGPLPVEEVADYVMQACEAIAEAHAIGIIHRDLKPQNLFLTFRVDGRPLVKVLDFGISKFATGANSGEHMSLTQSQTVLGTPHYMSPEQLRTTKNVDHRTDIWALGVILYELLGGRVPFAATSMTELAAMVLQDTPRDLREIRNDIPPEMCAVIARCLEKDPNARYQSVAALAHQLEEFVRRDSLRPAERIMAVARGSSGRQLPQEPAPMALGSTPQLGGNTPRMAAAPAPGPGAPDRQVIRSAPPGAPGMTGVTWADTQAMETPPQEPKSRGWVMPVVLALAFLGLAALGAGGAVAWKMTHKPVASSPSSTASPTPAPSPSPTPTVDTQPSVVATTTATTTAPPTTSAPPTSTPIASTSPKPTAKPVGKPPPTAPVVKNPKQGVDPDTPSDRN